MRKHITTFGEVMMRLEVPGYELLSQANQLKYSFSGTGVNFASMLAHLGHYSSIVTTLPNNPLGDAATAYLNQLRISTSFIHKKGNYLGMYFLENGFGIRPPRVTYTNRLESSFNTTGKDEYDFAKIAKQIDVVHFCGITLAMNDVIRHQMISFATAVKEVGGIVVFDCNYRPSLWGENGHEKARKFYEKVLYLADIVFMNEKDAIYTLGLKTSKTEKKDQLLELIPKVAKKYNISIIAGTHRMIHENNSHSLTGYLFKNKLFTFSKLKTFSVLDRIGTGDAFAGGVIHGELKGFSQQYTVDFATTAGALAHTIVGDTPILSEKDIIQAMLNNSKDIKR